MKLLLAVALLAVAQAEQVLVVPLPPAPAEDLPIISPPSMGQVFVMRPVDVVQVHMPIMRAIPEQLKVHFVDSPVEGPSKVNIVEMLAAPSPVKLAEAPKPAFETAERVKVAVPEFISDAPVPVVEPVRIAEPRSPVVDEQQRIAPTPVKLAEAPKPAFETVERVKVAVPEFVNDAPVAAVEPVRIVEPRSSVVDEQQRIAPTPVRLANAPKPAFETAERVKVAVPEFINDAPVPAVEPVRIAEPHFL